MGNYLNPGNEKFRRMIQSEIYVDKTGMIKYTNSVLDTAQNYVCVSLIIVVDVIQKNYFIVLKLQKIKTLKNT